MVLKVFSLHPPNPFNAVIFCLFYSLVEFRMDIEMRSIRLHVRNELALGRVLGEISRETKKREFTELFRKVKF
jgi:hypothetical protein